jgi:hypothetical protein
MATPSPDFSAPPAVQPVLPWSPQATMANAILLGPIAAGLVAYLNLKRLGAAAKAQKVLAGALLGSLILIAILIKTSLPSYGGLVLSIAIGATFSAMQQQEFKTWQAANPALNPRSAWASLGWGVLGLVVFFCMAIGFALVFAR